MSEDYYLSVGHHRTSAEGRCAMEWVAFIAGEPHSDRPACVSDTLRGVMMTVNDGLSDEPRQRLRPYLVRCIGTREDGLDLLREPIVQAMFDELAVQVKGIKHAGYLDPFENRFFGEDGWLERLLPLLPWPVDEIKRVRADQRRQLLIDQVISVAPGGFAEALDLAIAHVQDSKKPMVPQPGSLNEMLFGTPLKELVAKHKTQFAELPF